MLLRFLPAEGSLAGVSGTIWRGAAEDVAIACFDPSGTLQWAQSLGGAGAESVTRLETMPSGAVRVVGTFQQTVDFGDGPVTANATTDLFVLELR